MARSRSRKAEEFGTPRMHQVLAWIVRRSHNGCERVSLLELANLFWAKSISGYTRPFEWSNPMIYCMTMMNRMERCNLITVERRSRYVRLTERGILIYAAFTFEKELQYEEEAREQQLQRSKIRRNRRKQTLRSARHDST